MDACHRHKVLSLKASARLAKNCVAHNSDASEGDGLRRCLYWGLDKVVRE